MSTIILGSGPETLNVVLTSGSPFHAAIAGTTDTGEAYEWPETIVVRLSLFRDGSTTPLVWVADINGDLLVWNKSSEDVAAAAEHTRSVLTIQDGADEPVIWAKGSVSMR